MLRYKNISGYSIFAYCLMGNHLHLLIKTGAEPLERIMRRICGSYVYWYNKKYERTGNLFQDRFKSEPVENDEYLLTVLRYIHQNPFKAGMIRDLSKYKWSSYRDYLGHTGITDVQFILNIFNHNRNLAIDNFKKFTGKPNDDRCLEIEEHKKRITDNELTEAIENKFKINPAMVKNESSDNLKAIIKEILNIDGVSTRQLARVTGISPNIIWKM